MNPESFALQAYSKIMNKSNTNMFLHNCKKRGMYGFINRNGKIIAEPKFKNVKVVGDRMTVMIDNNKWMFIEPNGQLHEMK